MLLCVLVHYCFLSGSYAAGILGLEQFELGHSNGGSQDYSRIVYGMVSTGVVFDFKVFFIRHWWCPAYIVLGTLGAVRGYPLFLYNEKF